jgi:hypothetical protein
VCGVLLALGVAPRPAALVLVGQFQRNMAMIGGLLFAALDWSTGQVIAACRVMKRRVCSAPSACSFRSAGLLLGDESGSGVVRCAPKPLS